MASTRLYRTPGSASNQVKWTWSAWVKKCTNASSGALFCAYSDANNYTELDMGSNQIDYYNVTGGGVDARRTTSGYQRDPSAWYHIVVVWDSANASAGDRMKVYINGVEKTSFSATTNPSSSLNSIMNSTAPQEIGARATGGSTFFNGNMAHVHFCDGQAYAASDFGETDSTSGIWVAKTSPSVTYGTNGYFLKFASGASGADSSGNGNTMTVAGSLTNLKDTPDNNFCTMNPLSGTPPTGTPPVMSDGNTTLTDTTSGAMDWGGFCTQAVTKGKWYWEVKNVEYNANNVYHGLGQINLFPTNSNGGASASSEIYGFRIYNGDGSVIIYGNGATESTSTTTTNGDIFGIKMDLDNGYWYLSKNGTFLNSGNAINGTQIPTSDSTWYAPYQARHQNSGDPNITSYNFGNGYFGTTAIGSPNADADGYGAFAYTVPTGYYALCTNNIATYG